MLEWKSSLKLIDLTSLIDDSINPTKGGDERAEQMSSHVIDEEGISLISVHSPYHRIVGDATHFSSESLFYN